jgi:hypothetical protein
MPLGDSTGPLGAGPLTGRGLGPCADDALVTEIPPAYQNSAEVEKTVLGEDAEQAGNRFTQWNKLLKAVDEANPPTPAEQALMQAGGPFSQARLARVNRYLQAQRPQVKTAAFRDGYIDKQAGGAVGTAAGAVGGGVAGSKAAQAISRRLRRLSGVEPWEDDAPDLRAAEKIAKAVSRQQQRFIAMVLEVKKGKKGKKPASKAVAKAAAGISAKDARDFAETKHKGLPEEKQAFSEQHVQGGGRNPTLEMVNGWLDDIRQGKVNFAGYRKRLQQEQARTNSLNAGCIER